MNNLKSILFGFWVQDFSGFLDDFFFGGGTDFTRRYDMILDNCRSRESSQRLIKNASQSFSDDENGSSFQAPRSTLINIFMIADTYRYTYLYIYIYTQNGKNMYIYIYISICIYFHFRNSEVGQAGSTQKQRSRPPLSAQSIDFFFRCCNLREAYETLEGLRFRAQQGFFLALQLPPPVGTEHISPIEVLKLDDFPGKYPSWMDAVVVWRIWWPWISVFRNF